ncbi:MAG: transposase family protein [Pseudomonadaceae bacterium]|nr:transposase family protein [Pseudomonadaceae bacterium]MBX9913712.1 transposase family protein [Pseudomonadaceae bacterium]
MQNVIYAGLRNPARDQQIFDTLKGMSVGEAAEHFGLAPSTVRAAAKRIADLAVFDLKLQGG